MNGVDKRVWYAVGGVIVLLLLAWLLGLFGDDKAPVPAPATTPAPGTSTQ